MPHFTAVPWNAIVFTAADEAKINQINAAYAPYNAGLDNAFGASLITAEERDKRKIQFAVGANGPVIEDETLTDLSGLGLPSYREATSADVLPLSTGSVLGVEATPGNPATVWGVTKALTDQYVILPSEKTAINNARLGYNTAIKNIADANPTRVAFADVNAAFQTLVTSQMAKYNGVLITPNINPPTGIYSEDGAHLNSRGYAFMSHAFINAINERFGVSIPLTNLANYGATGLPIP